MKSPPIPENDPERLESLRRLAILDTPRADPFDRVTRTCSRMLDVPIVLVSLVDEERQWFKSRVGLDVMETPREVAFCAHVVHDDRPMVVPDALDDPRFADNPLVTGDPHVRAYLGVPVHAPDGHALGTICAIDRAPRDFTPSQVIAMERMARVVEQLIRTMHAEADAGPAA